MEKTAELQVSTLVMILIGLVVFAVAYGFIMSANSVGTDAITYTLDKLENWDGDMLPNGIDPCDCGSPANMDNEQVTVSGKKYCVVDWPKEQCDKIPAAQHLWMSVSSKFGGNPVCLYTDDGCFMYRLALKKEAEQKTATS